MNSSTGCNEHTKVDVIVQGQVREPDPYPPPAISLEFHYLERRTRTGGFVRGLIALVVASHYLFAISPAQEEGQLNARHASSARPGNIVYYPPHPTVDQGEGVPDLKDGAFHGIDAPLRYSLQRALDSIRVVQGVEGVSAAVLVPGEGIWTGVSGISSAYPLTSVDTSMLFGIGSNTKAFISTAILSLVDDGLVSLDDSLRKYLPAYPNITGTVTIRQLLNMTSGLFDYLNDSDAQGDSVEANPTRYWAPEELIQTFVGPPKAPPGGSYGYCNTNYVLLGMVISSVTGKSVSSQIRQRVLTPLSLDQTYLEVEESHTEPVAHPWDSGYDFSSIPVTAHFSTLWTAGGIISTGENMARWVRDLYEGSAISQATLTQMLTFVPASSTVTTGFEWTGYGLGVRQGSYYGKRVLGHAGAVMGYVSITGYLPQTGASFAILFNSSEASTGRALTALFDAYLRRQKVQRARPGVCYAVSGSSDGNRLYAVDSSTGALTLTGPMQYGQIVGLRVHQQTGAFWGLATAGGWELVQIDGESGQAYPRVHVRFPSGAPSDFKGLDFSPDGKLYAGSADGRIYTIDTATGVATLAATTGLSISGLAFDPTSGALWVSIRTSPVLRDRIYTVALPSGDTTGVGNTGFNQPLADVAFDADGNLFALVGNPSSSLKYRFARIDKQTGVGKEIGSVGLTGMVGIAFSPGSGPSAVEAESRMIAPAGIALEQNFPNPFNPVTTLRYGVGAVSRGPSVTTEVRLTIYDVLGREVAVLVNEKKAPGSYEVQFNASRLASGVYIYRLTSDRFVESKRMVLVR
jgi:D-alanyl-D-alanine carboxypeptidase